MDLRSLGVAAGPRENPAIRGVPNNDVETLQGGRSASSLLLFARMRALPALILAAAGLAAACGNGPEDASDDPAAPAAAPGSNDPHDLNVEALPDPLAALPKGDAQMQNVCARGQRDLVTRAFCTNGKRP